MSQGLAYFQQVREMMQKIYGKANAQIKMVVKIRTARAHKAEADRNWAKELLWEIENSLKQFEEELKVAQAKADEVKR